VAVLIKRYANRKLYNTDTSRYITLKGVGELLDRGEEVRVVDNETGEDITQVALSQILVDNKRSREIPSETLLTQILSRGGDAVYSAIRRSVDDASGGLGEFQERFRQLVQRSEARRAPDPHSGAHGHSHGHFRGAPHARPPGHSHAYGHPLSDDSAQARSESHAHSESRAHASGASSPAELVGAIRDAVARAFGAHDWPSRAEIERLNRNLERVAGALERLESSLEKSRTRS